jgi:hypothetical protein
MSLNLDTFESSKKTVIVDGKELEVSPISPKKLFAIQSLGERMQKSSKFKDQERLFNEFIEQLNLIVPGIKEHDVADWPIGKLNALIEYIGEKKELTQKS